MYLPYIDGECNHSGFVDPHDAKDYLEQFLTGHQSLVVAYLTKDADGTYAEFYHWVTGTWRKTNLDARGAIKLAYQQ